MSIDASGSQDSQFIKELFEGGREVMRCAGRRAASISNCGKVIACM